MEPPILEIYFSIATPIAIAIVLIAALAQYLNHPSTWMAALAITALGLVAAFFAPAVPILFGAGYLAWALFAQRGGRPKLSGSGEQ